MKTIPQHSARDLNYFLSLVGEWEPAYTDATISFLAVRNGERFDLLQGHLILPTGSGLPPPRQVMTASICGCSYRLADIGLDCRAVIEGLVGDGLETPIGKVSVPAADASENSASIALERFSPNFYDSAARTVSLSLSFSRYPFVNRQAEFQNDLRTGELPYDSLVELATELGLKPLRWDSCTFDVSANSVVAVDLSREIKDGQTTLAILAAHGISLDNVQLGFRVLSGRNVIERRTVQSKDLTWRDSSAYRVGEYQLPIPEGALVQCFASYRKEWLHQGWIVQPGAYMNPRRVAHEAFDEGLENTQRYLLDEKHQRQDARDLEVGVAQVMFMLGFSVDVLGGKLMRDNPDLLAMTPSGNIVVVECTTGGINADGKLTKLLTRLATLQEKLQQAGHGHVKCLPILVTSRRRASITDLEAATNAGIAVGSLEDLQSGLTKTMVLQSPDALFNQIWQTIHPIQETLIPGIGQ